MIKNKNTYKKFYNFLINKDIGEFFTYNDVQQCTGWKYSAINTYYAKKLKYYLEKDINDKLTLSSKFKEKFDTENKFISHMSQVHETVRKNNKLV